MSLNKDSAKSAWPRLPRALISISLALALFLAAAWSVYRLMGMWVHSQPEVRVPNLIGKSLLEALEEASRVGLSLRKETEQFHKGLPAGHVLSHIPSAGSMMRKGRAIRVILSAGGKRAVVPDLVGKEISEAEILLRQVGLALGEQEERYSLTLPVNAVVFQEPNPRALLPVGGFVNVAVSLGKPREGFVLLPDFVGRSLSDSEIWARENSIGLTVRKQYINLAEEGQIIFQSPAAEAALKPDTAVTVIAATRERLERNRIFELPFEVSQADRERLVRVTLSDPWGEREIYRRMQPPGSKLDLSFSIAGPRGKARIYVEDILVEERVLE